MQAVTVKNATETAIQGKMIAPRAATVGQSARIRQNAVRCGILHACLLRSAETSFLQRQCGRSDEEWDWERIGKTVAAIASAQLLCDFRRLEFASVSHELAELLGLVGPKGVGCCGMLH